MEIDDVQNKTPITGYRIYDKEAKRRKKKNPLPYLYPKLPGQKFSKCSRLRTLRFASLGRFRYSRPSAKRLQSQPMNSLDRKLAAVFKAVMKAPDDASKSGIVRKQFHAILGQIKSQEAASVLERAFTAVSQADRLKPEGQISALSPVARPR